MRRHGLVPALSHVGHRRAGVALQFGGCQLEDAVGVTGGGPDLGALAREPTFCAAPTQQGEPREVGAWTRIAAAEPLDVWQLVAARVLELARLCAGQHRLRHAALPLGAAEAVAFSELSRGVVLHWVKLDPTHPDRIHDYRVLAPTEWNFHPDGALARMLAASTLDPARLRLLVHAFDPCVEVRFDREVDRA